MRKAIFFVAALLPILALLGLLGLGMGRTGGRPAGQRINTALGEVSVRQQPAGDFALEIFNEGTLRLSGLRGKVVMVDFWASWCPPCRQEAPALAQVYREYREKGVEFVGVSIWDTEKEARNFVARYGITYPSGIDVKGKIAIDYGVTGIPEKFFISQDGILMKKFIGPMDEAALRRVLEGILAH